MKQENSAGRWYLLYTAGQYHALADPENCFGPIPRENMGKRYVVPTFEGVRKTYFEGKDGMPPALLFVPCFTKGLSRYLEEYGDAFAPTYVLRQNSVTSHSYSGVKEAIERFRQEMEKCGPTKKIVLVDIGYAAVKFLIESVYGDDYGKMLPVLATETKFR